MAGTATLVRRRSFDTAGLRKSVASPGGPTEAGLDVLERAGLRTMFGEAMDAVIELVRRASTTDGARAAGARSVSGAERDPP